MGILWKTSTFIYSTGAITMKITKETVSILFNPELPKSSAEQTDAILYNAKAGTLSMSRSAYNAIPKALIGKFDEFVKKNGINMGKVLAGSGSRESTNAVLFSSINPEIAKAVKHVLDDVDALNGLLDEHNQHAMTTYWFQSAFMTHPKAGK
jgi:hypothetical protein